MDQLDARKIAEVWQRVQGVASPQTDTKFLLERIADEQSDAATYLSLSRRFRGRESAIARRLAEQEQSHAACLRGMYSIITGTQPDVRACPAPVSGTDALLRRQYASEMRALAQYEAHRGDTDYGEVFAVLAQQEREHCRILLELFGAKGRAL